MKIIDKALPDLTPVEFRACARLNFGWDNGYMRPCLDEHRENPASRAIMLWDTDNDRLLGWALLMPTRQVNPCYGIGQHGKRTSKYALQMYIRKTCRGKGYAHKLMHEAQKHDQRPYVWPHDENSGALYSHYDVTAARVDRTRYLKKKRAA